MAVDYVEVSEAKVIAEKLLNEFKELKSFPAIKYLMKVSDSSQYSGKISKATGKWKYLTNYDYIIEVWDGFWTQATNTQKEALIYHELKHIACKENDDATLTWNIREHDSEEFVDVVKKYGAWNPALADIKKALDAKEAVNDVT